MWNVNMKNEYELCAWAMDAEFCEKQRLDDPYDTQCIRQYT